jgi:type II secretion system protein G
MKVAHTSLMLVLVIAMTGRGLASGHVAESDMRSFDAAIKMYRIVTGALPPSAIGLGALVERPTSLPPDVPWKKVMGKIPEDPWGHPYSFILDSDLPEGYGIFSRGSDGISRTVGNDPDDFNSWSPTSRGIEPNPIVTMPWLIPVVVLSGFLFFYLGVRVERYWNQSDAA